MQLLSIQYQEFPGTPQEWTLEKTILGPANLVVGKNSTGKSRFLKLLAGLARLITGEQRDLFGTGHYRVELEIDGQLYFYKLDIANKSIDYEELSIDGDVKFRRDAKGNGEISAEDLGAKLKFSVGSSTLIAQAKIDAIQHPYLMKLKAWASSVRFFEFGTELGRNHFLVPVQTTHLSGKSADQDNALRAINTVELIHKGLEKYGPAFKKNVLKDLASFGYPCTDVGFGPVPNIQSAQPLLGVYVVEKDLGFKNYQLQLSSGFFRAMALIACINYFAMSKSENLILIDDIGEGLDFERSSAVVKTLLKKTKKAGLQLVMTSNDRFIMNAVPLDCWTVLDRVKGKVKAFNRQNAAKAFEEFTYLGMNNFDFFATRSYKNSKLSK